MVNVILKAKVGSRAHNLQREDSDHDFRSVYVKPTEEILSLNFREKGICSMGPVIDDTSYEVGHFMQLAVKANPSILEVLARDNTIEATEEGRVIKGCLPIFYDPNDAFNAFRGYSHHQLKKFENDQEPRRYKFAVAYIRTLFNLITLFEEGSFDLEMKGDKRLILLGIRDGIVPDNEIIKLAKSLVELAKDLLPNVKNYQNLKTVNGVLLKIRKRNF